MAVWTSTYWQWSGFTATGASQGAACEALAQAHNPGWGYTVHALVEGGCTMYLDGAPYDTFASTLTTPDEDPPPEEGGNITINCGAACEVTLLPNALQTEAITALQTQVTALTAGAGEVMTPAMHMEAFQLVLGLLVVVWFADRMRRFFWRTGGDHA